MLRFVEKVETLFLAGFFHLAYFCSVIVLLLLMVH